MVRIYWTRSAIGIIQIINRVAVCGAFVRLEGSRKGWASDTRTRSPSACNGRVTAASGIFGMTDSQRHSSFVRSCCPEKSPIHEGPRLRNDERRATCVPPSTRHPDESFRILPTFLNRIYSISRSASSDGRLEGRFSPGSGQEGSCDEERERHLRMSSPDEENNLRVSARRCLRSANGRPRGRWR